MKLDFTTTIDFESPVRPESVMKACVTLKPADLTVWLRNARNELKAFNGDIDDDIMDQLKLEAEQLIAKLVRAEMIRTIEKILVIRAINEILGDDDDELEPTG